MEKILNLIGGKLLEPHNNNYIENYEPATGAIYSMIPDSGKEDIQQAVEAAKKAFPIWSEMSAKKRSNILLKLSSLIEENLSEFALAE